MTGAGSGIGQATGAKLAAAGAAVRACRPEDIANAVLWLASDESACVTGIGLIVDGGASARRAERHVD